MFVGSPPAFGLADVGGVPSELTCQPLGRATASPGFEGAEEASFRLGSTALPGSVEEVPDALDGGFTEGESR
jgi:hypothetical protein